jgi:hypothetical protein
MVHLAFWSIEANRCGGGLTIILEFDFWGSAC